MKIPAWTYDAYCGPFAGIPLLSRICARRAFQGLVDALGVRNQISMFANYRDARMLTTAKLGDLACAAKFAANQVERTTGNGGIIGKDTLDTVVATVALLPRAHTLAKHFGFF